MAHDRIVVPRPKCLRIIRYPRTPLTWLWLHQQASWKHQASISWVTWGGEAPGRGHLPAHVGEVGPAVAPCIARLHLWGELVSLRFPPATYGVGAGPVVLPHPATLVEAEGEAGGGEEEEGEEGEVSHHPRQCLVDTISTEHYLG